MLTGPEARPIGPVILKRNDGYLDGTGCRRLRFRTGFGTEFDVYLFSLTSAAADDKGTEQADADK